MIFLKSEGFHDDVGIYRQSVEDGVCYFGAYCSHAILTNKVGVYHCKFGACFKRLKNQK